MSQAELLPEVASVSSFAFQNFSIRTQLDGDILWFAARDVCLALNIDWSGKTLAAIPKDWQGMGRFPTPSGNQQLRAITEPAVYKLAFRSNKPEADAFTNWIASEVVPAIRKTGKYEVMSEADALPDPVTTVTPSTTADRAPLRSVVNAWARLSGQPFDACWSQLKAAFRITDIRSLPKEWIDDAIAWVQAKIDALQKALPPSAFPVPSVPDRRTFIRPRLSADDYAARAASLATLERDALRLEGETRERYKELQRRYSELSGSAFSSLLGSIPVRRFVNSDPMVDVLSGQFDGGVYRLLECVFTDVRYAIRAAEAANRILAESV